jgi:hypothetical protein
VLDIPGGTGKVPLNPGYLNGDDHIRDPQGTRPAIVHKVTPPRGRNAPATPSKNSAAQNCDHRPTFFTRL